MSTIIPAPINIGYVNPYSIIVFSDGVLGVTSNRPDTVSYQHMRVRTMPNERRIVHMTEKVHIWCWPDGMAMDELLRWLDRNCEDGSHI